MHLPAFLHLAGVGQPLQGAKPLIIGALAMEIPLII